MGGKGARRRRRDKRHHHRPETYKFYTLTFWKIRYGWYKHVWHNFKNKLKSKKCRRRWVNKVKASIAGCPNRYVRAGTVPVEEVLPLIYNKTSVKLCGKTVKLISRRYKCFKTRGTACVSCGIDAHYFAVEKHRYKSSAKRRDDKINPWHLNLYHKRPDGVEVMLTVDHIIPKARNGSDSIKNLQPMCRPCNGSKGAESPKKLRRYKGMRKKTNWEAYEPRTQAQAKRKSERLKKLLDANEVLV